MERNDLIAVVTDDVMEYSSVDIIAMAETAEARVNALNKIMHAALKVTTYLDWTIISGVPYLQETGACKVARLFGLEYRILEGFPVRELDEGYPSFTYRMEFCMNGKRIEVEGSRSGKDEFFAGRDRTKSPDQIDAGDVRKAAYTNCLNRGIKAIIPGLRNVDTATLEAAGIDMSRARGYSHKAGSRGGNSGAAVDSGFKCVDCGAAITSAEASFSQGRLGRHLCRVCQQKAKTTPAAPPKPPVQPQFEVAADEPLPWEEA